MRRANTSKRLMFADLLDGYRNTFSLTPEDTERVIGPVHMQPKTLLGTEIGQFFE